MSKQILMTMGKFGDVHPSSSQARGTTSSTANQSWSQFTPQASGVYPTLSPPQLHPHIKQEQVPYAPQFMSSAGGYLLSPQSQLPPQEPEPSHWMPANNRKRKAEQPASEVQNKRGLPACNIWEQIDVLRQLIPYPPKQDAALTLADVIDYITQLRGRIQQLEEKLSWYQRTAAQYYRRGSPIFGLVQRPNQMVETHTVPTTSSFPVNQVADAAAVGVPAMGQGENLPFGAINDPFLNPSSN